LILKGETNDFLLNRQILFLFQVLFLCRSACFALDFIFKQKPQAAKACGFFGFSCRLLDTPCKGKGHETNL